ncbi:hypothetical protein [Rosenbergiella collisarenosi]|uniref:hypothetical protein n=1 Tax=Rosenbergiella collisarenosi TaxID=1544695 RepID=UPI001E603B45
MLIGLTVTSIGVSTHSTPWTTLLLVMLCAILGIIIFSLYAFCFSTETAQGILSRYHRLINLFCAGFYTLVAIGFLVSLFT